MFDINQKRHKAKRIKRIKQDSLTLIKKRELEMAKRRKKAKKGKKKGKKKRRR